MGNKLNSQQWNNGKVNLMTDFSGDKNMLSLTNDVFKDFFNTKTGKKTFYF